MGIMECPQHPLVPLNGVTRKCDTCETINTGHYAGRSKKKGFHVFKPENEIAYPTRTNGTVADGKDFAEWFARLQKDPARMAQINADLSRPGRVSRAAHGVAMRSAGKEPMLSADDPFGYLRKNSKPPAIALGECVKRYPVKPNHYKVALGNWLVREWTLWTPKYSKGFIIRDDKGNQSQVFASWHLAKEAIEASGFVLIKQPGRQDSI